jgi:putative flippase GtrA
MNLAIPRWLRFAIVGGVNAAIDLGIFVVLLYAFGWSPIAAHTAGFLAAVINSYVMNKLWTFQDRDWSRRAIWRGLRFFAVAFGGWLVGAAVIALAVPAFPALVAKLLAIGATFVWNYTLSRLWVFTDAPPDRSANP